jgi:hypothetical protein
MKTAINNIFFIKISSLNYKTLRNNRIFGNNDDPVADHAIIIFKILKVFLIHQFYPVPHPDVFIDDRPFDITALSDLQMSGLFFLINADILVVIVAHDDRVLDNRVRADNAAQADHRVSDLGVGDHRPFGDARISNMAV